MSAVAGSLWSVAPERQVSEAQRLRASGMTRLHWDYSDGEFAAPGGFTADEARALTQATGLAGEAHLMTTDPLGTVDAWTEFCDLVVVHAEVEGWERAVDRIAARGAEPGLALSPHTPISVAPSGMTVLCMSITPGQAGSAFDERTLERVAALRAAASGRRIGIDGGVKRGHVEAALAAGVDWFVVGTDLFADGGAERWGDVLDVSGAAV